MGPRSAAQSFLKRCSQASGYRVTLYNSLASTGRGHLTDTAIKEVFDAVPLDIIWEPNIELPFHPNGMKFEALNAEGHTKEEWTVYSVGGGKITDESQTQQEEHIYPHFTFSAILKHLEHSGQSLWEYVLETESDIGPFLEEIQNTMRQSLERGLGKEGILPGGLNLPRKAAQLYRKATLSGPSNRRTALLSSYAHAVSEENASGGIIVTAPTCGACGVLPSVLRYLREELSCESNEIVHALATAGLIGNLIKQNASISGAEVGCQGEIGAACAMTAGAAAQLLGGSPRQIEYAAEMAMEHHLGLTCDPICGLVQIPCIERNAHASTRALSCAEYALLSDGSHRISFDRVTQVMKQTGHDLPNLYRETSLGGLASQ